MHAREQIREAIVTLLTGLETTGGNCFDSLVYPLADDELPALVVSTPLDRADADATLGYTVDRALTILVEIHAKPQEGEETAAQQIDTISAEVEVAIAEDTTLGNRVRVLELVSTETEHAGDLERPASKATMTLAASYRINATDPTTILTE